MVRIAHYLTEKALECMLFDAAIFVSIALAVGFALLQLSLVFGAPLGEYVLGGKDKVLPMKMRVVSGGFFLAFVAAGLSFLQIAGIINELLSPLFVEILLITYSAFLAYAIIGNGFLTKNKKERVVMTPCSILGFLCSVIVLVYSYAL